MFDDKSACNFGQVAHIDSYKPTYLIYVAMKDLHIIMLSLGG